MKRSRNASTPGRTRRRRGKAGQFVRGLILESLGVIGLLTLYATLQSGSLTAEPTDEVVNDLPPQSPVIANPLAQVTGYHASSWSQYHQDAISRFHQHRLPERPAWQTRAVNPR